MQPDAHSAAHPDGAHCPGCGAVLHRVHRHALDRMASVFHSVHRYRCTQPGCGWEGVVGREDATAPPTGALRWAGRLGWLAAGATMVVAPMLVLRWVHAPRSAPAAAVPSAPLSEAEPATGPFGLEPVALTAGLHDDGARLPEGDPRIERNATPLELRRNCLWGVPGRTPYRGSVEDALQAAHLPAEVVHRIGQMARNGWTQERVEISRTAIRSIDGRRLFKPDIPAMGFGNTLCFDTKVNFPVGHVEYAALYEAQDRAGKTYSVMVPFVCNNVSVLGVRGVLEDTPPAAVPEPAAWWLAATALAAAAFSTRRARRRQLQ